MKFYDSPCTVCGARDLLPFGQRSDAVHVLRCAVCGHGIVEQFQDRTSKALYGDEYFAAELRVTPSGTKTTNLLPTKAKLAWAASLLRHLKRRADRVLDIGCANGRALQLLGEGYEYFGIELNECMAQRALPEQACG